jgi:hypothetical protein
MTQKKETIAPAPTRHSNVVGGSSASRVMHCPASVELSKNIPSSGGNQYTVQGSMLHGAIAACVEDNLYPEEMLGFELTEGEYTSTLDEELLETKLAPALEALDCILDELKGEFGEEPVIAVEKEVSFGRFLPDAFGSCDILIRCGTRVVVLDWKFGDGVKVSAEENNQLMFYAAAAARTPELAHIFEGSTEVDLVIIQPPSVSVWQTTFPRLARFERELKAAVKKAQSKNPPMKEGAHCRWCPAKPLCPLMTGAVDRAVNTDLKALDVRQLGIAYKQAQLLKQWISELEELIFAAQEGGVEVPGTKLVPKRGTRKWTKDEAETVKELVRAGLDAKLMYKNELLTPAAMEKVLKKELKTPLPEGLVAMVSSGSTLVSDDDPRESVNGPARLKAALEKAGKRA